MTMVVSTGETPPQGGNGDGESCEKSNHRHELETLKRLGKLSLPPEALKKLDELISTYERLQNNLSDKALHGTDNQVEKINNKKKSDRWWNDLSQVELAIIERSEESTVRSGISSWRRRMLEVIGEERYGAYKASAPDIKPDTDINIVRADLNHCVLTVYHFYECYSLAAGTRSSVIKELFSWAAAMVAVLGFLMISLGAAPLIFPWLKTAGTFTDIRINIIETLLATAIIGVFGSVVSVHRRLEDPRVDVDPVFRYIQTSSDRVSIAISSPFFGALFGMLVFALLSSGIVNKIVNQSITLTVLPDLQALFNGRDQVPNFSKLGLYGFLAGFAELLVPDTLTRIAEQTIAKAVPTKLGTTPIQTNGQGKKVGPNIA